MKPSGTEGFAKAVSTLSVWRARAQALVEEQGGIASWLPRLDGGTADTQQQHVANETHVAAQPPSSSAFSSKVGARPTAEGQLDGSIETSTTPPALSKGNQQELDTPLAVPDKRAPAMRNADRGARTGTIATATGLAAGASAGQGETGAGLAGPKDHDGNDSDDLEYVTNPFEDEE